MTHRQRQSGVCVRKDTSTVVTHVCSCVSLTCALASGQVKVAAVRKKNAEKEKGFAKKMFG